MGARRGAATGLCETKCYHSWAESSRRGKLISSTTCPGLVKVANEEGWVITLHGQSSRDGRSGNIHWIDTTARNTLT